MIDISYSDDPTIFDSRNFSELITDRFLLMNVFNKRSFLTKEIVLTALHVNDHARR